MDRFHQFWALDGSHFLVDGTVPVEEDRGGLPDVPVVCRIGFLEKLLCRGHHILHPERPHAPMVNRAVAVVARAASWRIAENAMIRPERARPMGIGRTEKRDT